MGDGFPYPIDVPSNFSVNAGPTAEQLKPFGYAPGGYEMKCPVCRAPAYNVDKRAMRCWQCAVNAFRAAEVKAADTAKLMGTVPGQEDAERALSIALGRLKAEHARDGLAGERIITVLRNALDEEERLLEARRANERSY